MRKHMNREIEPANYDNRQNRLDFGKINVIY